MTIIHYIFAEKKNKIKTFVYKSHFIFYVTIFRFHCTVYFVVCKYIPYIILQNDKMSKTLENNFSAQYSQ